MREAVTVLAAASFYAGGSVSGLQNFAQGDMKLLVFGTMWAGFLNVALFLAENMAYNILWILDCKSRQRPCGSGLRIGKGYVK